MLTKLNNSIILIISNNLKDFELLDFSCIVFYGVSLVPPYLALALFSRAAKAPAPAPAPGPPKFLPVLPKTLAWLALC